MGCNQSRKEHTFSAEELKKLRTFHQKTANAYAETKGKDHLSLQSFRDLFEENVVFGERLHAFMLKLSTTERVDVETFIDVLELLISKSSNQRLNDMFQSQDKVGLLCMVLFPQLRKTLLATQNNRNSLISYSESLDFVICILRMFNAQPDQKVNESIARSISDRIFTNNDSKLEFWSYGMLIKEQINLIGSLIHIYLKGKFLDGTVSFCMPQMPDLERQVLVGKDELTRLYLNNQYLLSACEMKLLYQANSSNYNFDKLVSDVQAFSGQTFVLLRFEDSTGQSYTVGGFNPGRWQGNNSDSVECYVFSLSPRYRHYYPVLDSLGSRPVFRQQFVLNQLSGFEQGIAFGASKEDSRIWIDGKSLENTIVRNNDKFFKKGPLIPTNASNPVCTLIEVYGVRTDLSKKNFSYSLSNVGQLSTMLTQTREFRSTISGPTYDSQSLAYRAGAEQESEVVKRSKRQTVNVPVSSVSTNYQYSTLNSVPSYQVTNNYSSQVSNSQVGADWEVVKRSQKQKVVESTTSNYQQLEQSPQPQVSSYNYSPVNTNYLYQTTSPVQTQSTYTYQPLSNSVDPSNDQSRQLQIEALTKKYETISIANRNQGSVPRSTMPVEYTTTQVSYQNGKSIDEILGRSSSIATYQASNYASAEMQRQY